MSLAELRNLTGFKRKNIDRTSSLQKYFICDYCNRKLTEKHLLVQHIKDCIINRTCALCNTVFKNRGCFASHQLLRHGIQPLKPPTFPCAGCQKSYPEKLKLTFHIRREHYNFKYPITKEREINDSWIERVNNTDFLIEIKKTGHNKFVMRRVTNTDSINISDEADTIDLSHLYPTSAHQLKEWCHLCKKTYNKKYFKRHFYHIHQNIKEHECELCKKKFDSIPLYLEHNCPER